MTETPAQRRNRHAWENREFARRLHRLAQAMRAVATTGSDAR